jgi:hypothetical protein
VGGAIVNPAEIWTQVGINKVVGSDDDDLAKPL